MTDCTEKVLGYIVALSTTVVGKTISSNVESPRKRQLGENKKNLKFYIICIYKVQYIKEGIKLPDKPNQNLCEYPIILFMGSANIASCYYLLAQISLFSFS